MKNVFKDRDKSYVYAMIKCFNQWNTTSDYNSIVPCVNAEDIPFIHTKWEQLAYMLAGRDNGDWSIALITHSRL